VKVVAFDPGWQEIAVSEWAKGRPVAWYKLPRMKDYGIYLGKLGELARASDVFVIEDQHAAVSGIIMSKLPTFKKNMLVGARVNSIIKLAKVASEILIYGVQNDCEIHEVMASSWQSAFKNNGLKAALDIDRLPGNTKEASKYMAKRIVREVVKNHNIADAICLGYKWHYDQGVIYAK
jgi:hypothetical protein